VFLAVLRLSVLSVSWESTFLEILVRIAPFSAARATRVPVSAAMWAITSLILHAQSVPKIVRNVLLPPYARAVIRASTLTLPSAQTTVFLAWEKAVSPAMPLHVSPAK
jgi:hypothetical protein